MGKIIKGYIAVALCIAIMATSIVLPINFLSVTATADPRGVVGDVDGDGVVTGIDFALMKQYLNGDITDFPVADDLWAGDVDGSGTIDALDFVLIKQYLLHAIRWFPKEQPTVPSGLTASALTDTGLTLSWTSSSGIDAISRYEVKRQGDNNTVTFNASGTSYNDTGLTASTSYTYTIVAIDIMGRRSEESSPLSITTNATPVDTQAPTTPGALTCALKTDTTVVIKWGASTDNVGVKGYEVYRDGVRIGYTDTTAYTDKGLNAEKTYIYTVKAVDEAGNASADSNQLSVGTQESQELVFSIKEGTYETVQTLAILCKTAGADIYYTLDGSTPTENSDVYHAPLTITSTTTVSALAIIPGTTNSSISSIKITILDNQRPTTPASLKWITRTDTSITLAWNESSDNIGIAAYDIYRNDVKVGSSNSTSYTDSGLIQGNSYTYIVKARDYTGNVSDSSNILTVNPLQTDLQLSSISFLPGNLKVGDTAKLIATIKNTGTKKINGFKVEYSIDGNVFDSVAYLNTIEAGSSIQISSTKLWNARYGKHDITINVAGTNLAEVNTTNNTMTKTLFVSCTGVSEGTSFPLNEQQITTLYMSPGHETTPLPADTTYRISGNNSIVFNLFHYYSGAGVYHTKINDTTNNYQFVYNGTNTIKLKSKVPVGRWTTIDLRAGGGTYDVNVGNLKLIFDDGSKMTVKAAIDSGVISPLCLIFSYHGWYDWTDLYNGTQTVNSDWPEVVITLKCLTKELKGIEFDTNQDWDTTYDGVSVCSYPDMVLSLTPLNSTSDLLNTKRICLNAGTSNNKIYALGGKVVSEGAIETKGTVEQYDSAERKWTTKTNESTIPFSDAGAAELNDKIYIAGGINETDLRSRSLKTLQVYDPSTDTWVTKQDMGTPRKSLGLATVNDKIYAFGGVNNTGVLDSAEVYDPSNNTWSNLPNKMPVPRAGFAISVCDNKIYLIGGYNKDEEYLNSVDVYDPEANTWTTMQTPMPTARTGCEAVTLDNKIYVLGGWNGSYLDTVEIYDPATEQWTSGRPFSVARTDFGAAVVGTKIYIVGGNNYYAGGDFDSVEVYEGAN